MRDGCQAEQRGHTEALANDSHPVYDRSAQDGHEKASIEVTQAAFEGLAGTWHFFRTCHSASFAEQNAKVTGVGRFWLEEVLGGGWLGYHYAEAGVIRLGAHSGRCARHFTYLLDQALGVIEVHLRKAGATMGLLHRFCLLREVGLAADQTTTSC